jgi:hypothetical protein
MSFEFVVFGFENPTSSAGSGSKFGHVSGAREQYEIPMGCSVKGAEAPR